MRAQNEHFMLAQSTFLCQEAGKVSLWARFPGFVKRENSWTCYTMKEKVYAYVTGPNPTRGEIKHSMFAVYKGH